MNANGGGNESTLKEKEVNEVGYYGQLKAIFLVSIEFLNLRNLKTNLFCLQFFWISEKLKIDLITIL